MGYGLSKKQRRFQKRQDASWGDKYWIWVDPTCEFDKNWVSITYDVNMGGRKDWKRTRLQTSSAVQAMIYFEQHINPMPLFERGLPSLVTKRMVEQERLDKWAIGDGAEMIWRCV